MACHLSPEAASAQAALMEFIPVASQCIDESHWFCLRGKCDSSLCIHTMLLLEEYATMMYVAGLLQVGKQGVVSSLKSHGKNSSEVINWHSMGRLELPKLQLARLM
jgi:hypothetical protein